MCFTFVVVVAVDCDEMIRCRVQIDRQTSECPYEAEADHLIMDVWSPLESPNRPPDRLVLSRNDQRCQLVTKTNPSSADRKVITPCDAKGFEIQLTLTNNKTTRPIAPHQVVFVFHLYTHQPRRVRSGGPLGMRHTSTAVLFGSQLGSNVTLYSTHHAETKWIKRARRHVKLNVAFTAIPRVGSGQRPSLYWEDRLWQIWREGIQPDVDWVSKAAAATDFNQRCQVVTPLSVPVHGVPVAYSPEEAGKLYNDQYPVSKGLTAQSLWYMPDEQIVTDDWIRSSMLDVLRLRDVSWTEFIRPPPTEEERQKRLSDVVKLVTYHAATWPYFPDSVAVRDQTTTNIEEVPIDDMDPARIKPGDCEDVASISIQIANDIIRRRNVQCPFIRQIQRYLVMLGVPCGVSGLLQGSDTLHVYGMFIPAPLFCSLAGLELTRLGDDMTNVPLHCALIEGTVLSSPFYTTRERVSSKKLAVCSQLQSILQVEGGEGGGDIEWNNYCIPQAWSLRPDSVGRHVHSSVLRIFPCMPELVLGDWAKDVVKRSYIVLQSDGTMGVPATQLLSRFESVEDFKTRRWRLQATHDVPSHVIDLEREVIRNFYRPVTPIDYGYDPATYMNKHPIHPDVRYKQEDLVYRRLVQHYQQNTSIPIRDPNHRLMLYVWKLVQDDGNDDHLFALIEKINTQVQVRHVQRLGHGFAFVFYF